MGSTQMREAQVVACRVGAGGCWSLVRGSEICPFCFNSSLPGALTEMLLGFVADDYLLGNQRYGDSTRWCVTGRHQQGSNINIGFGSR